MADLDVVLSWLGMSQYLDRFVQAGFDTWETLLWITESDLEILNVEIGHRRKLQKEIANSKRGAQGLGSTQPVDGFIPRQHASGDPSSPDLEETAPKKRSYKHHPKPDPNAPERPYSAYVLFSNHTRDQLKEQNLSFTDLSKQVGERWKSISADEKEAWKQRGAGPWEDYKARLAEYQKTEGYQAYQDYLAEFKAAQAAKAPAVARRPIGAYRSPATLETPEYQQSDVAVSSLKQRPSVSSSSSKTTVKRIKVDEETQARGKERAERTQVCEACRERNRPCSGERPTCQQCSGRKAECHYKKRRSRTRGWQTRHVNLQLNEANSPFRDIDSLWQKAKSYEDLLLSIISKVDEDDQRAIQDAIHLHPQLEVARKAGGSSTSGSDSESTNDEGGGERTASRVGSMGETDRVNEHNFTRQGDSMDFAGQASDTKWLQRLEAELGPSSEQGKTGATKDSSIPLDHDPPAAAKTFRANMEDVDMSIVGSQIYPLEMPIRSTADKLIQAYFTTIHLSFPIFQEAEFISQYEEVFNTADLVTYHDRTFIALLQLVFAVGAVHAHLINAEWAGDERDHTLYIANARMLSVDSGILNDLCYLGQTRIFALGALYLVATDQINRSWNLAGLAIRSAQSMGLHLLNVTPSITVAEKDRNARIWYAISALESILTVITGRPSMINGRDCSVSLLQVLVDEDKCSEGSPSDYSQQTSPLDLSWQPSSLTRTSSQGPSEQASPSVASIFFKHYAELCIFAKEVLGELYSPGTRHKKWAEIQENIENYDKRLFRWKDDLSPPFDVGTTSPDPQIESCRVALRILFYSTRAIIHRPCLCRLDEAIPNQSRSSKRTNRTLATNCVDSARAVLKHIVNKPDSTVLTRGATWWMILNHFKRSHIILLLELSFRAEHVPSNVDDLISEAKESLKWLRHIGASSPVAKRTWFILSRLLHQAAQRVGGDTDGIITASEDSAFEQDFGMDLSADFPTRQPPGAAAYDRKDPYGFSPVGLYEGYPLAEWDEFGFLRAQGGTGSFFPQEDHEMGGRSGS